MIVNAYAQKNSRTLMNFFRRGAPVVITPTYFSFVSSRTKEKENERANKRM